MNIRPAWTPPGQVPRGGRPCPHGTFGSAHALRLPVAADTGRHVPESAGDGDPDPGAFPKRAVDLGLAAEALGPVAQVAQALAAAGGLGSVEAEAVVINLQHGAILVGVQ